MSHGLGISQIPKEKSISKQAIFGKIIKESAYSHKKAKASCTI
jgi:hypothetical protein